MAVGEVVPETRFTSLSDDKIAYQVFGDGPVDLIVTPSAGDPIDLRWDWPAYATFLRRLGRQARVVMFDPRGTGASDAPSGQPLPSWERWADDARTVMEAVAATRVAVFGMNNGGPSAVLFAASHPDRVCGLIVANSASHLATGSASVREILDATTKYASQTWGTSAGVELPCPDSARDPAFVRWASRSSRLSVSPRDAGLFFTAELMMDVSEALPLVRVPTLVMHREGFTLVPIEQSHYLSEHVDGARFVSLPGRDATLFTEPHDECLDEIESFLHTLEPATAQADRSLAAILFTDIVNSTGHATLIGDREWRNLLETHDAVARTIVDQHRGRLIKTTGDGILATFDGPGRAIQCGSTLTDAFRPLGLEIRAAIHAGEIENRDDDIAGIAVHIAARVLAAATPGDVYVTATVPMLVAGTGFDFEDRGQHELKGIDGTWQLFAVRA